MTCLGIAEWRVKRQDSLMFTVGVRLCLRCMNVVVREQIKAGRKVEVEYLYAYEN